MSVNDASQAVQAQSEALLTEDRARARQLIGLAVASLCVGGVLALLLVVGRTPGIDRLVGDPLLFKRALVVHVVLALVIWFHAFTAGLASLLPGPRSTFLALVSPYLTALGLAMILAAPLVSGAQPVLSNYVPVVDHPIFLGGLAIFGLGVLLSVTDHRLFPPVTEPRASLLPPATQAGLRAASVLLIAAVAVTTSSLWQTPGWLEPQAYYENLFWGGGHVLQFASVAAMLAVWRLLLDRALGEEVLSPRLTKALFALLVLPALIGMLLPFYGTTSGTYREGFTTLMRWGIFPPVLITVGASVRKLARRRELWSDPRVMGFLTSATLSVLGFVLGALIRGSNTMVPAHYHASIGAVSSAFMCATFVLLEPLGLKLRVSRWVRWQPVVFGFGQAVFAMGFGLAGAHGMARKVYGAEQLHRTVAETFGLGVMAIGGVGAFAGGLLFLGLMVRAWSSRRGPAHTLGETAWTRIKASIPSRS